MADQTEEKRKYQRFSKKIPIEFSLAELQDSLVPNLNQQKGLTTDVSQGGLCFECSELTESTIKYLNQQNLMMNLLVFIPLAQKPIRVVGVVSWYEKIQDPAGSRFLIGIRFRSIKPNDLKALFRQTNRFWYLVLTIVVLTIIFVMSLLYHFVISKP